MPSTESMVVGAHVPSEDPLEAASILETGCIQMFVGDPQSWKKPPPRADAARLRASDVTIYVHAPYLINVASPNNRVRIPSRKILAGALESAEAIGAAAVIVHAGHAEDGIDRGFRRWRKVFEELESPVPILIENTAGGTNAMARRLDRIARLWEAVTDAAGGDEVGFVLDTCHAHAGGIPLGDAVERVRAITGRIDLVHVNDSRDAFDSGADRHANLGAGALDGDEVAALVCAARAPVIVETPGGADGQGADIAWIRQHAG